MGRRSRIFASDNNFYADIGAELAKSEPKTAIRHNAVLAAQNDQSDTKLSCVPTTEEDRRRIQRYPSRQRHFCKRVTDIRPAYDISARCLELEITESVFLEDMDRSNERFRELREAGVQISIDDFGTGYSSFSHLRDLQFDRAKIDRAFICDLPDDRAVAITKAIVAVVHTLGKSVTAEGVVSEFQLASLRSLGVDSAQGFLIGRPLETDDLAHWLTKRAAGEDLSESFIARAMA